METIPLKWKVKNCPEVGAYYDRKCETGCYREVEVFKMLTSHNVCGESILKEGRLSASFGSGDYNVPEITLEQFRELTNTQKETKYGVMGCPALANYFRNTNVPQWNGECRSMLYYKSGNYWKAVTISSEKGKDFTPTTLENYLKIINQTPNTTMKNAVQPTKAKAVSITKTETVTIGKKKREITITVLTEENNPFKLRAGYSVRNPEDKKSNSELAKQISIGRAMSDKTNMVDMYLGEGMQNKKYILYSIAEQLFRELNSGTRQIKGVK